MTGIGRPDSGPNAYNGISIGPSKDRGFAQNPNSRRTVGDDLNQMAGIKPESKFVDPKKHNQMDKDGFMKLLAHQLTNQDPLSPMDQKKFASELAQFSQLEQLANMNSKLEKMGGNAPSETKFYGASFIGKKVMTSGTTIDYEGDGSNTVLPFHLPKDAKQMMVRIYDERNQMIRQFELGAMISGPQSVRWDGISQDGSIAAKGKYRFEVRAWDHAFNDFKGETQTQGLVTGVSFENGETVLEVDGSKKIFLRDVSNFKMADDMSGAKKLPSLNKEALNAYNNNNASNE
jgi:flagellar basal-body rod modification protein FlgD